MDTHPVGKKNQMARKPIVLSSRAPRVGATVGRSPPTCPASCQGRGTFHSVSLLPVCLLLLVLCELRGLSSNFRPPGG